GSTISSAQSMNQSREMTDACRSAEILLIDAIRPPKRGRGRNWRCACVPRSKDYRFTGRSCSCCTMLRTLVFRDSQKRWAWTKEQQEQIYTGRAFNCVSYLPEISRLCEGRLSLSGRS